MRVDHKFYKAHGQYDFPQKQWPKMLAIYAVGTLLSNQKLKSKMGTAMTDGMLMPYWKVLEQTKNKTFNFQNTGNVIALKKLDCTRMWSPVFCFIF